MGGPLAGLSGGSHRAERLADLCERQADALGGPDVDDPSEGVAGESALVPIVSVTDDEAVGFVELKSRNVAPGPGGDLADAELPVGCDVADDPIDVGL